MELRDDVISLPSQRHKFKLLITYDFPYGGPESLTARNTECCYKKSIDCLLA